MSANLRKVTKAHHELRFEFIKTVLWFVVPSLRSKKNLYHSILLKVRLVSSLKPLKEIYFHLLPIQINQQSFPQNYQHHHLLTKLNFNLVVI